MVYGIQELLMEVSMLHHAKWITTPEPFEAVAPTFSLSFSCQKAIAKASLSLTSVGVYVATINGSSKIQELFVIW